jgi:hypothetical protein
VSVTHKVAITPIIIVVCFGVAGTDPAVTFKRILQRSLCNLMDITFNDGWFSRNRNPSRYSAT